MINRHQKQPIFRVPVLLFTVACLALGSEPGAFERTLSVSGPVKLDVRSDPGGVEIMTGSSDLVRIRALIKPLYGRLDLDLAEANICALVQNPPIEQVGNTIRVGYPKDPALLRAVTIHFEIEAPRTTQVQAYTQSGGVRIAGITGPAEVKTTSGRTEITDVASEIKANGHSGAVVIRNAGGRVFVRTGSGGVELSNIEGAVEAETTSGRTEITRVVGETRSTTQSGRIDALQLGGSVHAQSKSGAIRISQTTPAPIRALTQSGAIQVTLAGGAGYNVDAQSNSGKVSASLGQASRRPSNAHSFKAQVGPGGPLVDLDTHSSKIDID